MSDFDFCINFEDNINGPKPSSLYLPSFPPSDDFVVTFAHDGKPLSYYGDSFWDTSAYGFRGFNFALVKLSTANKAFLKQLIFAHLFHIHLFPGKVKSLGRHFTIFSKLCKFSDYHGITIDRLYQHPQLAIDVIDLFSPDQQNSLISILSILIRGQDALGWILADSFFIEKLKEHKISHTPIQSAYIPPRIWMSLIQTIEEIMYEFEQHQRSVKKAHNWAAEAYKYNKENGYKRHKPFIEHNADTAYNLPDGGHPRRVYKGGSKQFYEDFGLADLLAKRIGYKPNGFISGLNALTRYVNLVRDSAFIYILAHSMQRVSEGLSLRSDCFQVDDDPKLGQVAFIVGETTKTDPDSDARWVVPISVKRAVKLLNVVRQLKLNASFDSLESKKIEKPFLMSGNLECWRKNKSTIISSFNMAIKIKSNPNSFKQDDFKITKEDYKLAYQLTPNLTKTSWFKVGNFWHFTTHQLRRTLAVNLYTTDVPPRVIQWLMKHRTLQQSYYYGRNYSRLRVNQEVNRAVLMESYRKTVSNLVEIANNSLSQNIHPSDTGNKDENILKLIKVGEHKNLEHLVQLGQLAARPTLLGFCMQETCEYGGIESAVHCAGVDGQSPCKDAIFSTNNLKKLENLYASNLSNLNELPVNSPRYAKLKHENEAIEVYFHATS